MILAGLYGGALADSVERRKILLWTELGLLLVALLFFLNSLMESPSVIAIFALAAMASLFYGLHRPAHESLTPRLVDREDFTATAALNSLKGTVSMIGGPALGGFLIATLGISSVYIFDVVSFSISLFCLLGIRRIPPPETASANVGLSNIIEGLKYAGSRQDLMGTYIVDFIAMVFAMPNVLFPAFAETLGGPKVLGSMHAAPAVGALAVTLFSGWMKPLKRHGQIIVLSACVWGLAIAICGWMTELVWVLFFLGLAGAADMVSAVFRFRIWNETIPDRLRGRLAGVEMISYLSGPQLAGVQVGLTASVVGVPMSFRLGGALCAVGVWVCAWRLPKFWFYRGEDVAVIAGAPELAAASAGMAAAEVPDEVGLDFDLNAARASDNSGERDSGSSGTRKP
jgi:MFS family permease